MTGLFLHLSYVYVLLFVLIIIAFVCTLFEVGTISKCIYYDEVIPKTIQKEDITPFTINYENTVYTYETIDEFNEQFLLTHPTYYEEKEKKEREIMIQLNEWKNHDLKDQHTNNQTINTDDKDNKDEKEDKEEKEE